MNLIKWVSLLWFRVESCMVVLRKMIFLLLITMINHNCTGLVRGSDLVFECRWGYRKYMYTATFALKTQWSRKCPIFSDFFCFEIIQKEKKKSGQTAITLTQPTAKYSLLKNCPLWICHWMHHKLINSAKQRCPVFPLNVSITWCRQVQAKPQV